MGYWFAGEVGIYQISKKIEAAATLAGEDPLGPMVPSVWEGFNTLHERVSMEMGDQHLIEAEVTDRP